MILVLGAVAAAAGYLALPHLIPGAILYAPNTDVTMDPAKDRLPGGHDNVRHLRVAVGPPDASLSLWCFRPKQRARGTILVFHGIRDSKWSQVGTGAHLARLGYVAVLVDSRGHGRSSGRHLTYGVRESRDARQVLDRLKQEGLLVEPVGTLGFSYGGAVALQLAALDSRVEAVVTVATFSSLRQTLRDFVAYHLPGIGRVLPTEAQMSAGLARAGRQAAFDPAAADNVRAAGATRARLLIIHGAEDAKIPPAHARRICRAAGARCRLVEVPGADHDSIFGGGVVSREMTAWFNRWLR